VLLCLVSGCAQFIPSAVLQPAPTIRAVQGEDEGEKLPAPQVSSPAKEVHGVKPFLVEDPGKAGPKVLPISLDTVFRLANDQNGEISLAREKLQEAHARQDLAGKAWIPDVYIGTSYYRHEGGVQNFNGQMLDSSYGSWFSGLEINSRIDLFEAAYQKVDAERKVWQKKGELSKISSETLLDVASTYIDFLTALEGQRVADELDVKMAQLLERAGQRAKVDKSYKVELARVSAENKAQKLVVRKLRESAASAEAKIKHLLGVDPSAVVVPVDRSLMPLRLVDANVPPEQLIDRAWTHGPGVAELTGLLDLVERSVAQSNNGSANLMPVVELNMGEGLFGAGPGSSMDFQNRWDMCVRLRWNLKKCCVGQDNKRILESQRMQVHQTYQNLRSKLALGVQDARETSLGSEERLAIALEQVEFAESTFALSKGRLDSGIPGASYAEVLLTLRALVAAHYSRVEALRDLDKAQLRLFVLVGDAAVPH